jgi:hypothetical protein
LGIDLNAEPVVDDADVLMRFEKFDDNREFGLMRRFGRSGTVGVVCRAPLRTVMRGLNSDFANLGDPAHIRIEAENGE